MPGYIIQGVRGEGKSLAAVYKMREYLLQGRPVATNLDIYLENLLPPDNTTLAYRLPDHPRLEDFEILPPAYDVKYKGEDKNGLLVLDELGTWLNSRSWSDKDRLKMLNWLFLSRKYHWDLILLAQDHEMIDVQVRTTLCDYLVQATRTDRKRIPYLGGILKKLGLRHNLPKIHRYYVFYGLNTNQEPQDVWSFSGKDIYSAYDTNQRFKTDVQPLCGTLVDMRSTYTYLPSEYLTNSVHVKRLDEKIKSLKQMVIPKDDQKQMALKTQKENPRLKIIILASALAIFLGYRAFTGGFDTDKFTKNEPIQSVSSITPESSKDKPVSVSSTPSEPPLTYLLSNHKPRLSTTVYSEVEGFYGSLDFLDSNNQLVETVSIRDLHSYGAVLIRRPYGVEMIYKNQQYVITSWRIPDTKVVHTNEPKADDQQNHQDTEKS